MDIPTLMRKEVWMPSDVRAWCESQGRTFGNNRIYKLIAKARQDFGGVTPLKKSYVTRDGFLRLWGTNLASVMEAYERTKQCAQAN